MTTCKHGQLERSCEICDLEAENAALKEKADGFFTALQMAARINAEQQHRIKELREALEDITDPIVAWRRDLKEGYNLDGAMCVAMANDPQTYIRMAKEALYTPDSTAEIDALMRDAASWRNLENKMMIPGDKT